MDWTDRPPTPDDENDHEVEDSIGGRPKDKPRKKLPPMTEPPVKIEQPAYAKNEAETSKLHEAIDAAERKLEEISVVIQKFHDMASEGDKDSKSPQDQLRQQHKLVREEIRSIRDARDKLRPRIDDIKKDARKLDDEEKQLKQSNANLQVPGVPRVDSPEECEAVIRELEERHQTTTLSSQEEKLLMSQIQKLKAAKVQLAKNMSERWGPLMQRKAELRQRQDGCQGLYDEDAELKKQLDKLLKKEDEFQKMFAEKEESLGPIRELQTLRSTLHKTRNDLEKELRVMTFEHIRADKEYESYLRKMEFWERQEAQKRQEERRALFKERSAKAADRSKDRQVKDAVAGDSSTPRPRVADPSRRVTDASGGSAPVPIPMQPSSAIYVQGLPSRVNKSNFLSLLPDAAKQQLSSHRLVQNGIAFLEYDGVGPAKAALAALRAAPAMEEGGQVFYEFAKKAGEGKK